MAILKPEDIQASYETLIRKNRGCTFFKMDLHIHTPASKCYDAKKQADADEYLHILNTALDKGLDILAITDHNTFAGYFEMRRILDELHVANPREYGKYHKLLILPGVEISNFGKHTLAIFPETADKTALEHFLLSIGIEDVNNGDQTNDAYLVTPTVLLQKIDDAGGLAILAHVDAAEGLLDRLLTGRRDEGPWLQRGNSVASVIRSPHLSAISLNNRDLRPKLDALLNQEAYNRKGRPLAVIACSDSHSSDPKNSPSGFPIGERFSYVKLSEPSWEGLRLALLDPDVRVYDDLRTPEHPHIIGVAIQGQYLGGPLGGTQVFPFSSSLNCIIGARGTGKSTLLDVTQYTLYEDRREKNTSTKFDAATVFVNWGETTYALTCETKPDWDRYSGEVYADRGRRGLFRMNGNGNFVPIEKARRDLIRRSLVSAAYRQRVVFDLGNRLDGPLYVVDEFLKATRPEEFENIVADIRSATSSLGLAVQEFEKAKKLDDNLDEDIQNLVTRFVAKRDALARLSRLRGDLVEQMNQYLKGKVRLTLLSRLGPEAYESVVGLAHRVRLRRNIPYEQESTLKKALERVAHLSSDWSFMPSVITEDTAAVTVAAEVSESSASLFIDWLKPIIMAQPRLLDVFPDDVVEFDYNVNDGTEKQPLFRRRGLLSMGQKSVAILLMIMKVGRMLGDTRPLLIDQPEDDLDNMYIYSSLVDEIRQSKDVRQMIFSTHNANIPISADAEQIIMLQPSKDGERGEVGATGSIDKKPMIRDVVAILEGGSEAFRRRATKYQGVEDQQD